MSGLPLKLCATLLAAQSVFAFEFGNLEPQKDEGIAFGLQLAPDPNEPVKDLERTQPGFVTLAAPKNAFKVPNDGFPPYGEISSSTNDQAIGFETYMERAMRAWYNICRISPIYFRDNWLKPFLRPKDVSWPQVFNTDAYTAKKKAPIHWNLNLNRAARAHAMDRMMCSSSTGGWPHNSCNGTSANDRISQFIGSNSGEVLVYWPMRLTDMQWRSWPVYVIAAWICDGFGNGAMQIGQCCTDKGTVATSPLGCASGMDGHRSTIMLVDGEVGCGFGIKSDGAASASVCNEYGVETGPYKGAYPIHDGTHLYGTNPTQYAYWSTFYLPGSTVNSATVYIDGAPHALALKTGEATRGVYVSNWFTTEDPNERCHCYHFEYKTSMGTFRLPPRGSYYTTEVGSCTNNFFADSRGCSTMSPTVAGGTFKPTGRPTTRPPTRSPTTAKPTRKPTRSPTTKPTRKPTRSPTTKPTRKPTKSPTTKAPTRSPTTKAPTKRPTTKVPTKSPTTKAPTKSPTTKKPTRSPTRKPTRKPTRSPTRSPTRQGAAAQNVGTLSPAAAVAILLPLCIIAAALFIYVVIKFWLYRKRNAPPSVLVDDGSELENVPMDFSELPDPGPRPADLPGAEDYPDEIRPSMMG